MFRICWKNKFSGEQGYVKSVSNKEKHFVNTYEVTEAKSYKTIDSAKKIIEKLISYGEAELNELWYEKI